MRTKLPWFLIVAVLLVTWIAWRGVGGGSALPQAGVVGEGIGAADSSPAGRAEPPAGEELPDEGERRNVSDAANELVPQASHPTHRVTGQVVDDARFPVAGARVALGTLDAPLAVSRTSDDGSFELLVDHEPSGRYETTIIRAESMDGRCALQRAALFRTIDDEPLDVDAGSLVLGPAHELSVRVTHAGSPVPHASVEVHVGHARLSLATSETDALGELQLDALPTGAVHLVARHADSVGAAKLMVPDQRLIEIQLDAGLVARFEMIDAATAEPVVGAEIALYELAVVPAALPSELPTLGDNEYVTHLLLREIAGVTDDEGRAEVRDLLPGVRYRYAVRAGGYVDVPLGRAQLPQLLLGDERNEIDLQPSSGRRVTWPIVAGDLPVPADGTPLQLRWRPGSYVVDPEPPLPIDARVVKGRVVAQGVIGRCQLLATTPDGAQAHLYVEAEATAGSETSFHASRRIEVLVRDARGAPLAGQTIVVVNQGNNELCEPVRTGQDGVARLEGLTPVLATVGLRPGQQARGPGSPIGTVDLEQGDGRLEVTWSPPARSRARLRFSIDGSPRLPGQFQLGGRCAPRVLEEHPESGQLTIDFETPDDGLSAEVFIQSALYRTARAELTVPADGSEASAHIELWRACVLSVRVDRTGSDHIAILPQHYDEEQARWVGSLYRGRSYPNGPGDGFLFKTTGPGRWRASDEKSGLTSEEVLIEVGDTLREVVLDLASQEWVSGRVEAQEQGQLGRVRVALQRGSETVLYAAPSEWSSLTSVAVVNGAFRIRVPSDEEVGLVALHPWLVQEGGAALLRGGRDGVVLRLVEGDGVVMSVPQLDPRRGAVRIARYAPGSATSADARPIAWHQAAFDGDVLRCALPSGKWTLLVDPGDEYAPLAIRDVEIDGTTRLPAAQFSRGSSVRVKLLTAPGSDSPRISIFATRLDLPQLRRIMNSGGEPEPELHGLGPGLYSIRYGTILGDDRAEHEVEVDGVNDVEFELDLR